MPDTGFDRAPPVTSSSKFRNCRLTAKGEPRAFVSLRRLTTLWFNTGSLCNIACNNCYIESSPRNDRLAYLTAAEVCEYIREIQDNAWPVEQIGFTGGEPFLNREFVPMLRDALSRGFKVLVLTNAMKPMLQRSAALLDIHRQHPENLSIRVSIDHYLADRHEAIRGHGTWGGALAGLRWLCANGFRVDVAGRKLWNEPEATMRAGFAELFAAEGLPIDAADPNRLVLFPEMDIHADVPEITTRCWGILGIHPDEMMCAWSRMIIKRKGESHPVVVPCTLLPYDPQFELGRRLADAAATVHLNHPFCAQFCVLGGASCSSA